MGASFKRLLPSRHFYGRKYAEPRVSCYRFALDSQSGASTGGHFLDRRNRSRFEWSLNGRSSRQGHQHWSDLVREGVSDSRGDYVASLLPPGRDKVEVSL